MPSMATDRENDVRIDISADVSGLKAGASEAAVSMDALSRTFRQPADALEAAARKNDDFVASLRRQVDTFGMTRGQVISYDAQLRGLTGTHLESANALGKQLDALDANEKMLTRLKYAAAAAGAVIGAAFVGAVRQMYQEVTEAEQSGARLDAVLRATGGAARLSGQQIRDMSAELARSTLFDDEQIQDAAAMMLTFKSVQGDTFRQAMQMSADLAATFGGDLKSSVMQLGKALEDPEQGLTALRRSGVSFTDAQKDLIKGMVEAGQKGEALTLILKLMREQGLDKTAQAMKIGITKESDDLGKAWRDLLQTMGDTGVVKGTVEAVFGSLSQYLRDMKNVIESGDWLDKLAFFTVGYTTSDMMKKRGGAGGGASGSWGGGATGAWGDEPKVPPKEDKPDKAVAAYRRVIESLKFEAAQLGRSAEAQEVYNRLKSAGVGINTQAGREIAALTAALSRQQAAQTALDREMDDAVKAQEAMVAAYDAAAMEKRIKAEKALAAEIDRINDGLNERALAESDSYESLEDLIEGYELETELLGMSNEQRELAIAMRKLEATGINLTSDALDEYRRRLTEAVGANQAAKQARNAAEEWKRASADIERSLTDALMRGFEDGAGFAENFVDTLKNMFKTLVLRPIIQPIAQYGSNMVMGMMGMGGMGASGTAMASGSGLLGNVGTSMLSNSLMGSIGLGSLGTMASYGTAAATGGLLAGATQGGMLAAQTGAFGAFGASSTASALGGAAATGGGATGMLAAAAPWIAGGIAVLGALGVFKKKPSNKGAWGSIDLASLERSNIGSQTGDKFSQENNDARDAMLDLVASYTQGLTALGGTTSGALRIGVGSRDGLSADFGDDGSHEIMMSDYGQFIDALLKELTTRADGLSESLKGVLIGFNGTTEELINLTGSLAVLQDYAAADPLTAVAEAAEAAGRSAWQVWQQQGTDLRVALAAWDGSAAAAADLASLTQSRYQIELALAQQIHAALASTSAMFASTAEEMRYSTLDQAGKYDYLRDKSVALEEAMASALDPMMIEDLAKQLNENAKTAWQLLGEEEKKIKIDEYESYLAEIDALTTERLAAAGTTLRDERNESLPTNIQASIETAMARVAEQFMAAATAQQAAAETPLVVEFTANVPGLAEVSGG